MMPPSLITADGTGQVYWASISNWRPFGWQLGRDFQEGAHVCFHRIRLAG